MNLIQKTFLLLSVFSTLYCQMTGGWTNHQANETAPDKVIQFIVKNLSSNAQQIAWSFDQVLNYQTQVVAGTNHKVVLQVKSSSGTKKVIFALVFEGLGKGELSIGRLNEIVSSNQNSMQNISDDNALIDLKAKIINLHQYHSQGKIKFNIRKIRWSLEFTVENDQQNYYLNYELEGTNNEISLWEHWLRKLDNKNAIDASLYLVKLPLGKFTAQVFQSSQECEGIQSYLLCGVKNCSNKKFLTDGKCQKTESNI